MSAALIVCAWQLQERLCTSSSGYQHHLRAFAVLHHPHLHHTAPSHDIWLPVISPDCLHAHLRYVNNPTLADVTFMVEGRKFHAHRIALLASSDAFRAMFNGGYR